MTGPRVALIDQDRSRRQRLVSLASHLGLQVAGFDKVPASPCAEAVNVRLVIQAGESGIGRLRSVFPNARVLMCSSDSGQSAAVRALRQGADDFVCLSAGDNELAGRIEHHLGCLGPSDEDAPQNLCGLVGESAEITSVLRFLRRVARTDVTVLIEGETGTGKECAALLVHQQSKRAAGPLVALNCAAIPADLFESELFGFERGAFSGAVNGYSGKLKLADGGTLLLDEVGELSTAAQVKVLRAIETREAYRLGGRNPVRFNVRIIAATNRDLAAAVRSGHFREDLYYRLAVAVLQMPPLRERPGDLPALARHLLANVIGLETRLSQDAVEALMRHDWPGNARELRNVLEIASITAEKGTIRTADLPPAFVPSAAPVGDEKDMLLDLLRRTGGNKAAAARELACSRMTLYRRLARNGIDADAPVSAADL